MKIKQNRFKGFLVFIIAVVFAGATIYSMAAGLTNEGTATNSSSIKYKSVEYTAVCEYDPYIFRKQWVPLPDKVGLSINLGRVCTEPVMEFVIGTGTWDIQFLLNDIQTANMEIEVLDEAVTRIVADLPQEAYINGYDSVLLTQTSGRNAWLSYLKPLTNSESAVVLNPIPPMPSGKLSNPTQHDVTGAVGYYVSDDGGSMTIRVQSISELDILLLNVVTDKGKEVATFPENSILETIDTSENWLNDYIAVTTGESYEMSKLYLQYRYIEENGSIDPNELKSFKINPFTPYDDEIFNATEIRSTDNLDEFDFVIQKGNEVRFDGDLIKLDKMLFVPKEKRLILEAGQTIELSNGASIFCRSAIAIKGTEDKPVSITSPDGTGHGLVVLNGNDNGGHSYVDWLICDNLGEVMSGVYFLTGCVTFYESDVTIRNSKFLNNRSEDGLNIVRSDMAVENCTFYNTFQDAFDADFCTGYFESCHFEKTGNDAFDVSTSDVKVLNCTFLDIHDKACSIGEHSTAYIENIDVVNAQAVIGAKDMSTITAKHLRGENISFGYLAYQKKPEFGPSVTYIEDFVLTGSSDFDFLIEKDETYYLDGKLMQPKGKKKEALLIEKIINEEPIQ